MTSDAGARRRAVAVAGHTGDVVTARAGLGDDDATVRETALGALARLGALGDDDLSDALRDPSPPVRRRAAELSAARPSIALLLLLDDVDPTVVEVAAWACGERTTIDDTTLLRVADLARSSPEALVREACVAALGSLGDERGLEAILAGCDDKPAVRRRAVLALAPFEGAEVETAIQRALGDRDWQVRQAAEDLRRA